MVCESFHSAHIKATGSCFGCGSRCDHMDSVDSRGETRVKNMAVGPTLVPMCYDCIASIPLGPVKEIVTATDRF